MNFLYKKLITTFIITLVGYAQCIFSQPGITYAEYLFDPISNVACILLGEEHANSLSDPTEIITRTAACPHILNLINNHNYVLQLEYSHKLLIDDFIKEPFGSTQSAIDDSIYLQIPAMKALQKLSTQKRYENKIITTTSRSNAILLCARLYFAITEDAATIIRNEIPNLPLTTLANQQLAFILTNTHPVRLLDMLFFDKTFQERLATFGLNYIEIQTKIEKFFTKPTVRSFTIGDLKKSLNDLITQAQALHDHALTIQPQQTPPLWSSFANDFSKALATLNKLFPQPSHNQINVSSGFWQECILQQSFERFSGACPDNALAQEMNHFFMTMVHYCADFSFLHQNRPHSGIFASNKGILYAGSAHCQNISKRLKSCGFQTTSQFFNNHQALTAAQINQFFTTINN